MTSILTRSVLILLVFATCGWIRAEEGFPDYQIRDWRTRDGLPQNTVNALAQTAEGYLWVGTRGGLARFDGARFKNYGLEDGLKGLGISCLKADRQGGLWIGTIGGGLSHWQAGKITTLTTADGLANNDVMALAVDGPDVLWVGTKSGLQRLGPQGFTTIGDSEGLNREVVDLVADGEGGVWASFEPDGLFRCRPDGCTKVPGPPGRETFHGHALMKDQAGDLWVGIGNGDLLRRHGDDWTLYGPDLGLPPEAIICLAEGAPGEIWAGTLGGGLWVLRRGRFYPVPNAANEIRTILKSRDGSFWIGKPAEGLAHLTPRLLKDYPVGAEDRPGQVHGMIEEPIGTFWIGTYGGGLFHGPLDHLERLPLPPELDGHRALTSVLKMNNGSLIFGGPRLLVEISPSTGVITGTTPQENIHVLCTTADDSLYLGTREGQLMRRMDGKLETVAGGSFPAAITAVVNAPGNALWVATQGAGLFRWHDGKSEHWGIADGLPTDVLRALYPDPDDPTLWIGTLGGGLAWLRDGQIHTANQNRGLRENSVLQILDDHQGNLWLGANRGIQRVSKSELLALAAGQTDAVHPLVLDESDGMVSAECSGTLSPAGYQNETAILYFSTVRGVVAVDPSRFGSASLPPAVIIESLSVNGIEQSSPHDGSKIPAGPHELEIRYTAFSDSKPDQLRFRYRLGSHGKWLEGQGQRFVRFSQLPPGEHEFQVTAANPDGRWNPDPAKLSFTVLPTIWQSPWFKLAVLVAGVAMIWNWFHQRLRRAAERERLLTAETEAHRHLSELTHLNRVSTLGGLATTLAHELNQPLAAIHCNAESARIFLDQPVPNLTELGDIIADIGADGHRASEVILRMRSMLQRHPFEIEKIDVPSLIDKVAGLLKPVFQSRKAKLTLEIDSDLPQIAGDSVHLQQLLMNLTLNALEAMGNIPPAMREVTMRAIRNAPHTVKISVIDRGPGLPAAKLAKIDEPFVTTKKDGMGMGLTICSSIAAAHGGILTAENPPSGGAIVNCTLPEADASH